MISKKWVAFGVILYMQSGNAQISWWDMKPHELREKINQCIMNIEAPVPVVWSVFEQTVENENRNTPIRIYVPDQGINFPVILFIHGGAWVAGNLDTHDNLTRYLCAEVKAIVVSVGYLNSPEGKFPVALEQCYDTLLWIMKQVGEFHGNAEIIAVVGDSAGGNMAAALCLLARDRSGPKIDVQVLINPVLDVTCNGIITRQDDALDTVRWQVNQYVSDVKDVYNPYVSPLIANDVSNLPSAVIILAEHDALYMDGQNYAHRLCAVGVPTYVYCQQGAGHLAGHGARASTYAKQSLDVVVAELKKIFFK